MIRTVPNLQALAALLFRNPASCLSLRRFRRPVFANVALGTHAGHVTRTASATFARKFLLAKAGASAGQAAVCGASDNPIGIVTDEAVADDPIALKLLGVGEQTAMLVASGALNAGVSLYAAASGKVQGEPTTAGTYYLIGRALTSATGDGDVLEAETIAPVKVVVLAALTSGQNSTTAATDLGTSEALANALKSDHNKLQTDVAALAAALASPGLVKILGA